MRSPAAVRAMVVGMAVERYDLVVVGLGPIGAGALRSAAAAGARVVGIGSPEPAVLADHEGPFASHYDSGRVTRHVAATFEWAELARRAIADYPAIEQRSGIAFHRPVGVVYATLDPHGVAAVVSRLAALRIVVDRVDTLGDPRLHIDPEPVCFVEGSPAGHVDPRRMTAAQVACGVADGAHVERSVVERVESIAGGWRLHVAGGAAVDADRVVLAGGPHTGEIDGLPPLPPMTVRAEVVVTAVLDAGEQARLAGLPSVLAPVRHEWFLDVYLVPPTDYPDGTVRIKLGATRHAPIEMPDAASRRAWMRGDAHADDLAALRQLTEQLVPGLRAERWETKPCLITDTPTDLPYVDHLADGLVIAAGCNGYAAKSGDAIGALAAQLALTGRWADPVLAADRFAAPG
jgi:sarcosine oxidase